MQAEEENCLHENSQDSQLVSEWPSPLSLEHKRRQATKTVEIRNRKLKFWRVTPISGVNHRKEEFDYFLFSLPRSTLQNILFRFGYYNNLTFVIPTETGDLNLEIPKFT